MTGTEVAEEFARLLGHAVPTVILTGDPANAEVPWLADAPVWVARKPLLPDTLLAALPPLVAFRRAVAAVAAALTAARPAQFLLARTAAARAADSFRCP